ncbi:3-hydroxybutyrate dehydrogenase [Ketogulonicigenium robustum]|uniref:3-hydroxybutyrate dehydrogenase n=1 Tax=Ketogulonicigenium robustum TaxID=92947 RepID=A0A1W6NZ90_9RHOB|nr:SDR family NAD(P)-dependent oxidoreductase [Ketogulonicigenium robustum]ARO14576.1 3-hydroxybutyrate dehydrogenase [Ketogulonicigenium robustum]
MQFKDKVVLITGAAGGIGAAAARKFAAEGAKLALVDLSLAALEKTTGDITGDVLRLSADVSKEDDVAAYVKATVDHFGTIDVFVNNAGINGDFKPIPEQTVANYEKVLGINVIGAFLGLKYVLPVMYAHKSGAVVNTASNGGLLGAPGMSAYVASKHAVMGLNKSAALEAAPYGVRVNAVAPSGVDTQMMRSIETNAAKGHEAEARKAFEDAVPLKRYATADEIADLMLFLASDKASFVTGAYYRIDGGGAATSA